MQRVSLWFLCSMVLLVVLAGCQPAEPEATANVPAEPGAAETATVEPSATAPVVATESATAIPDATEVPDRAGTATPKAEAEMDTPEPDALEALVRQDLAQRLGIAPEEIELVSKEAVEWPDGSLGCPAPGVAYTQVVTPGYEIILEAEGERYEYHTDREKRFVLCENGEPQFPAIPIDPDDIDDGEPWVPVDPPPTEESP